MNKEQINNTQFWTLLVCLVWPGLITYGSGLAARAAGRDMWLSGILALLTTGLFVPILIYLGRKFPGKTLTEYSEILLGKLLGKVVGLVVLSYFLVAAAISASIYLHHLVGYLLPETPLIVLIVIHLAVVTYLVWQGPEVIARVSVVALASTLIFYILATIASVRDLNYNLIFPLFDTSLFNIGLGSIKLDNFTGQSLLVLAMFLPLVKEQKKAIQSSLTGLAIGGFFYIIFFVIEIMVMGPHLVAQMRTPSMDFVRSIQITQYLHRFESFFVALWYWSMLTQASALTYCSTLAFKQTIGIKSFNKWVVGGMSILLAVLTYIIAYNRVTFLNLMENWWYYYFLPIQFGLPFLLLLVLLIRIPFQKKY